MNREEILKLLPEMNEIKDESLREIVATRPPLNIYRMLAHAGPAAVGFLKLGAALLRENQLDSHLRELTILRVGILCRASPPFWRSFSGRIKPCASCTRLRLFVWAGGS